MNWESSSILFVMTKNAIVSFNPAEIEFLFKIAHLLCCLDLRNPDHIAIRLEISPVSQRASSFLCFLSFFEFFYLKLLTLHPFQYNSIFKHPLMSLESETVNKFLTSPSSRLFQKWIFQAENFSHPAQLTFPVHVRWKFSWILFVLDDLPVAWGQNWSLRARRGETLTKVTSYSRTLLDHSNCYMQSGKISWFRSYSDDDVSYL